MGQFYNISDPEEMSITGIPYGKLREGPTPPPWHLCDNVFMHNFLPMC